jgi:pimeloyl-ACP methyl ester carboxylesterase
MQGKFVDVAGCRTHYLDEGDGPTLVLLHGAGVTSDAYGSWFRTIPGLSRFFRVIAFDQIGFGQTDLPPDSRYANRLQRVDHALAFLDRIGVAQARLVGHSEGGFMATRMAIARPALAERLVIVTSGGTAPRLGGNRDTAWMRASEAAYAFDDLTRSEEAYIAGNARLKGGDDEEYEAILREGYRRAAARGQIEIFRNLPASETDYLRYTELQEEHIHPFLSAMTAPTLLAWAAEDATVPVERGIALARMIPRADMHVFGAAGHMVMLDRTSDFNRLLASWCSGQVFPA